MTEDVFAIEKRGWSLSSALISGIDPRTRILATIFFAVVVVSLRNFESLFLALMMAFTAIMISDMPLLKTLRCVVMVDGFIVFMLFTFPFTISGDEAFSLFGFSASWQGLEYAAKIALRANAIVLMMLSLLGALEPVTLGHTLFRLKVPETLVQLLLFTVRYIDVIHQEYQRLRISMKARCFRPRNSKHTYVSFGYLISMMLVRAMDRSERIYQAMKCRGFSGRLIILDNLRFSSRDMVFSVIFGCGLLSALWLEHVYATTF